MKKDIVRKQKKRRKRRKIIFRILLCLAAIVVAGIVFACRWFYKTYGVTLRECYAEAEEVVEESSASDFTYGSSSKIYASDGTLLAELSSGEDMVYVEYEDIPDYVKEAFIAVEDRTFWENPGIDIKGIVRVLIAYVKSGGDDASGASTITQQLARAEFLTNEVSLERKVREIFISLELTKKYTKEELLEFYCNSCCFANGIYGIGTAAEEYFGKTVDELTLSECAYLCAIPNRPEYYDPWEDAENAITRRDKILEDMYECGYVTAEECAEAESEEITVLEESTNDFYNYETTYAVKCATEYLMESVYGFTFVYEFDTVEDYESYNEEYDEAYETANRDLYTEGYEIYTSIDLESQEELQAVVDEALSDDTEVSDEGIYNLQGAVTAVDNETHKVIAVIGGRTQDEISEVYSLNRACQTRRQPGSSIKPILVYGPALDDEDGEYSASTYLTEISVTKAKSMTSEEIDALSGSRYTLRNAVENSRNGCAYYLLNKIGVRSAAEYLYKMEFGSIIKEEDMTLSAALGGLYIGVTTEEMVGAYSTLANHGQYTKIDCITSILDADGNEIYEEAESVQVYTEEAADEMTDILTGVLKSGTAKSLYWYSSTDTEAAGKTGTTNDYHDGWFCGYTPSYTIAVWVGTDDNTEHSGLQGATYPANIWKEAMLALIDGEETEEFDLDFKEETTTYTYSSTETEEEEEEVEAAEEVEEEEAEEEVEEEINGLIADEAEDDAEEEEEEEKSSLSSEKASSGSGSSSSTDQSSDESSKRSSSSSESSSSGSSSSETKEPSEDPDGAEEDADDGEEDTEEGEDTG